MAAVKSKRAAAETTSLAQKPGSARNAALAALASRGTYEDLAAATAPGATVGVPALTGRSYDLGGDTRGVLLDPWLVVDGRTVFRGDVVSAPAGWFEERPMFAVLAA